MQQKNELNQELLSLEYLNWVIENGNGRNSDDLRFGQYIYNKYEVETDTSYNSESAEKVYEDLRNQLGMPSEV